MIHIASLIVFKASPNETKGRNQANWNTIADDIEIEMIEIEQITTSQ